jgi:hypothetical protein
LYRSPRAIVHFAFKIINLKVKEINIFTLYRKSLFLKSLILVVVCQDDKVNSRLELHCNAFMLFHLKSPSLVLVFQLYYQLYPSYTNLIFIILQANLAPPKSLYTIYLYYYNSKPFV